MTASLSQIRDALANQLTQLTGIDTRPRLPDNITPPMMALMPRDPVVKYDVVMGEHQVAMNAMGISVPNEYSFDVVFFTSRAPSIEQAQEEADAVIDNVPMDDGNLPIPLAIAHDTTLGHVVEFCEALNSHSYGQVEVAGQFYFSVRVAVTVSG